MAFTTIQGSGGAPDSFLGTAGVDVIALQNQAEPAFLSARQDADIVTFTSFTQVLSGASLYGGQGNDQLTANNQTTLSNSFVAQNEGNDTIALAAVTNSTVQGNEGADLITTAGLITSALVNGNQGNDTVNVNGGASAGSIFSGVGFDQVNVAGNLSGGTRVQANEDDDIITIAAGLSIQDSTINGNQGNDNIVLAGVLNAFATSTIYGGSGNDTINTAANTRAIIVSTDDGNDNVTTGAGNDQVFNTAGNDTIATAAGNDTITSTAGNAVITTAGVNNSINAGGGNVNITSTSTGGDTIVTGTGTDTITTGAGNNTVDAGGGNDTITGNNGTDSLNGGTGNDTINGQAGIDQLTGGAGADRFDWTSALTAANANNVLDYSQLQGDVLAFATAAIGGAAYALGAATLRTAAQFAAAGNANNIVFDTAGATNANLSGGTATRGIAVITTAGTVSGQAVAVGDVLYDADANFTAGAVIIGNISSITGLAVGNNTAVTII